MKIYVLDTNLLVLLVVGSFDRNLIQRHKRCREFDGIDFDLLVTVLRNAENIVCTPHVLAEASNLIRLIGEPLRSTLTLHFSGFIEELREVYVESRSARSHKSFVRLGLTDATLLKASKDQEILTTDLDLYFAALAEGSAATNFTHLREQVSPRF